MTGRPIHEIRPGSREPVAATIRAPSNPTATDPEFLIVAAGVEPDPDDAGWTAGSWVGTWAVITTRIDLMSPTIGAPGADLELPEFGEFVLYGRWGDRPAKDIATIVYGLG